LLTWPLTFNGNTKSQENPARVTSAAPSMLIQLLVSRTRMGLLFMDYLELKQAPVIA
jgi:hypothetical protein